MTAILPAIEQHLLSHRFVASEHVRGAALAIVSAMADQWRLPDERPLLFAAALYDDPRSGGAVLGALHRLMERTGNPMLFRSSREHPEAIAVDTHGISIPQQRCFRIGERPAFLPDERPEVVKPPIKLVNACQRLAASAGTLRLCYEAIGLLGRSYAESRDKDPLLNEEELQQLAHEQITTAGLIAIGNGRTIVIHEDLDAASGLFLQVITAQYSQIRADAALH